MLSSVRNAKGDVVLDFNSDKRAVLDPRIAYVMTNMMEGVLNFGTAFPVRARGFNAPAAGKTGSSHDGWFAGYTSNLLCIVWVGYDDYSDIRLSGAQTALPIWAEFMKKAVALPQYSDVQAFSQPSGVVDVQLGSRRPTGSQRLRARRLTRPRSLRDRTARHVRPGRGHQGILFTHFWFKF